jgi:hypothetical protein
MKTIVVERTLTEPVTVAMMSELSARGAACLEAHRVHPLRSLVSADGLRTICEYEAPDAESVRAANRKLGLPFDRVWVADIYEVGAK